MTDRAGWTVTIDIDTRQPFTLDALARVDLDAVDGVMSGDPDQRRWSATVSIVDDSDTSAREFHDVGYAVGLAASTLLARTSEAGLPWGDVARVEVMTFAEHDRLLAEPVDPRPRIGLFGRIRA